MLYCLCIVRKWSNHVCCVCGIDIVASLCVLGFVIILNFAVVSHGECVLHCLAVTIPFILGLIVGGCMQQQELDVGCFTLWSIYCLYYNPWTC